jgi:DNA-binding Xre family transcriptional regulator
MVRKLANNETNNIDIELLVDLCNAFDCNVGDLFYIEKAA